jgi:hypothetical protein
MNDSTNEPIEDLTYEPPEIFELGDAGALTEGSGLPETEMDIGKKNSVGL